ncbi:MAG: DUF2793 domain-containing protein [Bdellovibrionota bacterium]
MPATTGPNLGLRYGYANRESGWGANSNDDIKKLDAVVHLSILDRDLSAPPGSPAAGGRYIVGSSPTGAWATHAGEIAVYRDGAWAFYVPKAGWRVWVEDERRELYHDGTTWRAKFFESAQITLTAAAAIGPTAHNLGVQPKRLWGVLKCITGEHGYSAGDEIEFPWRGDAANMGLTLKADATNYSGRFGSATNVITVIDGSGLTQNITLASWKLLVRASVE